MNGEPFAQMKNSFTMLNFRLFICLVAGVLAVIVAPDCFGQSPAISMDDLDISQVYGHTAQDMDYSVHGLFSPGLYMINYYNRIGSPYGDYTGYITGGDPDQIYYLRVTVAWNVLSTGYQQIPIVIQVQSGDNITNYPIFLSQAYDYSGDVNTPSTSEDGIIDYPVNIPVKSGDEVFLGFGGFDGGGVDFSTFDAGVQLVDAKLVCPACQSGACTVGSGPVPSTSATEDSVNVAMSLGGNSPSGSAGSLSLYTDTPLSNITNSANVTVNQIYTTSALQLFLPSGSTTITDADNNQSFRQILTDQTLVDRSSPANSTYYQLDFYHVSQVTGNSGGLYTTSGSPFMSCKFEDPGIDGNTGNLSHGQNLLVTRTMNDTGVVTKFLYEYNGNYTYGNLTLQGWKLTTTEGNSTLSTEGIYRGPTGDGTTTELHLITDGNSTISQTVLNYNSSADTQLNSEILGSDNHYTNYTYADYGNYVNSSAALQKQQDWTGHWTYYADYDEFGRETERVEQVGNNAYTGNWTDSSNDMFETDYSGDNGTVETDTETYLGTVVSKHWRVLDTYGNTSDGLSDLRLITDAAATDPSASDASNSTNLITTTYLYDSTDNGTGAKSNSPFLVIHPDGTATEYQYYANYTNATTGNLTTVTYTGNLASGPSGYSATIDKGTKTTVVTDLYGSLISSATVDIASNTTIASENVSSMDAYGRPLTVDYLGNFTEDYTYDCCADLETTDRYGVVSKSTYDGLHRLTLSQQYADPGTGAPPELDTEYTYDAAGRQTKVTIGPSGNVGAQIVQSQSFYDDAGELTGTSDGLGRMTNITTNMSGGYLVKTTTNPDQSTRIETYYQDGTLYKVTGTGVHGVMYTYGVDSGTHWRYTITTPLEANGTEVDSANVTEYTDFAGRPVETVAPSPSGSGTVTTRNYYKLNGQLDHVTQTGKPVVYYSYDDLGRQNLAGQDMDGSGSLSAAGGADRATATDQEYTTAHSTAVQEVTATQWLTGGNIVTTTDTAVDGNGTWVTQDGLATSTTSLFDPGNATVTETTTNPDATKTVTVTRNGRKVSVTQYAEDGTTQLGQTTYAYDDYNRVTTQTDARNGNTTFTYDDDNRVLTEELPAPGGGGNTQTLAYAYVDGNVGTTDYGSEVIALRSAGGNVVEASAQDYYATGELLRSYGAAGPAAQYGLDYAGRPVTLETWQNATVAINATSASLAGGGGAANTTWAYNDAGALVSKTYDDGNATAYAYNDNGTLASRTWARTVASGNATANLTANFTYGGNTGDLLGIGYSDGVTPNVTYGNYDELGRPGLVEDGSGSRTLTYTHGIVTEENYTSGILGGFAVNRSLDAAYRVDEVALLGPGNTTLSDVHYNYSASTGLLGNVTWGSETAAFTYAANSSLATNTTFAHSGTTALTTARQYDYLNRLTEIDNVPSGTGGNANVTYGYNDRNQRTAATRADGSYWSYGYDSDGNSTAAGQVTSANVSLSNGTVLPGQEAAYTYDALGNRQTFGNNPTAASGNFAFSGNYYAATTGSGATGANDLNQYGSRDVPRKLEVLGVVNANATVAVNGVNATLTGNTNWYRQLTVSGNAAAWTAINITANHSGNQSAETGRLFLAANPEPYQYDKDGNLLSDGKWSYVWDAENRLSALVTSDNAVAAGVPRQAIIFGYDDQNRRVGKAVYDYNAAGDGTWVLTQSVKYLYDGYNLIAEMNAMPSTPSVVRLYAWGPDLSGTMDGAGGVGGLLMASLNDGNSTTQTVYYGYDGNGNVITLADTTGNVVANYDYDAFGSALRTTGYWARFNPIRFSTKYWEANATYAGRDVGLYYYGERWYNPEMGRWVSRDPSGEQGGVNLYGNGNDFVNFYDSNGYATGNAGHPAPVTAAAIEAADRKVLLDTISSWRKDGYSFSANLLEHFLAKTGTEYDGIKKETDEIKDSKKYRQAAFQYFAKKAQELTMEKKSGTVSIKSPPFAFNIDYSILSDGDLFYALGGAHFYFDDGQMCLSDAKNWRVDVNMIQKDDYTFSPTSIGGIPGSRMLFPSYAAAHVLQTDPRFHYPRFDNIEKWKDNFSSSSPP